MTSINAQSKPKFEFTACPICDSNEYRYLHASKDLVNFIDGIYSIVQCRDCGQIRTQPRPLYSDLSTFYPATYSPYNSAFNARKKKFARSYLISKILQRIKGMLYPQDRILPSITRAQIKILDYGCGDGSYLINLDQKRYECYGIDFSDLALERVNSKNISTYKEPVPQDQFEQYHFQIITAWMVLEHTYDPITLLRKLKYWLDESGYLVISVPDYHSLHKFLLPFYSYDNHVPNHTLHFTRNTISALLQKCGFRVISMRWQRNSRSLMMTIRNYISCNYCESKVAIYDKFCNSCIGKAIFKLIALLLGITTLSGRVEVTAVIDI